MTSKTDMTEQAAICETCRKWRQYPKSKDAAIGVCIESRNGSRGDYIGGLKRLRCECDNWAPLTFAYMSCEYYEEKNRIYHLGANTFDMPRGKIEFNDKDYEVFVVDTAIGEQDDRARAQNTTE